MPLSFHINGPAVIYVGEQFGKAGPLLQLGVSEEGADVWIERHVGEIKSDAAGPQVAADLQNFGKSAQIQVGLSSWDEEIRQWVESMDGGDDLDIGTMGLPIGTSGNAVRVVIDSTLDLTWRFYTCVPRGPQGGRRATKYTTWRLNFYSWPLVGAESSPVGKRLGDRVKG